MCHNSQCAVCDNGQGGRSKAGELHSLMLLQHREISKLLVEEKMLLEKSEIVPTLRALQEEKSHLETMLRALALDEEQKEKECLVTKTLGLDEVRRELSQWQPAIQAEYDSLKNDNAIRPISREEYVRLCRDPTISVETVPSKLVATLKPPSRRKARIVACGNRASQAESNVSAGGADTIAVRALISAACQRGWEISAMDVKTAFLQAPCRTTPGKVRIVTPPAIVKESGVLEEGLGEY